MSDRHQADSLYPPPLGGPISVGIPTLSQYAQLEQLCRQLLGEVGGKWNLHILIIDNGGGLFSSKHGNNILSMESSGIIEIKTPPHNLGVAGSWNLLAKELGRCIIANDDVELGWQAIAALENAAACHPEAVILENDDPVGGFATFLLHRPETWLEMGGFDEVFNPAYFEDNDARRRLLLSGMPTVRVNLKDWRHNNSSTLKQSSEAYQRMHWCLYKRNLLYYQKKWGGEPGQEIYQQPFNRAPAQPMAPAREGKNRQGISDLKDKIATLEMQCGLFRENLIAKIRAELTEARQQLEHLQREKVEIDRD